MSVTLDAPETGVVETIEEEHQDDDDKHDCHLYFVYHHISLCGQSTRAQDRCCLTHQTYMWEKGMTACPACGALICLECLLKVPEGKP